LKLIVGGTQKPGSK